MKVDREEEIRVCHWTLWKQESGKALCSPHPSETQEAWCFNMQGGTGRRKEEYRKGL